MHCCVMGQRPRTLARPAALQLQRDTRKPGPPSFPDAQAAFPRARCWWHGTRAAGNQWGQERIMLGIGGVADGHARTEYMP